MKKILITGAGGFVGKYLCDYLVKNFIYKYKFNDSYILNDNFDVFIHLAGKAHDLRKSVNTQEYYYINTDLTKNIFDLFLKSQASVFIFLSSVKAVSDTPNCELNEEEFPQPITDYGKSKLLAEQYIQSFKLPKEKKIFILRPSMIHGPGNKGNLNLLYKTVQKGFPWPLGMYNNSRSFCSIENLCFIINELIENTEIESGVYNISDDMPLSTNEIIQLIAISMRKSIKIVKIPKPIINFVANIGSTLGLPLNYERLIKLTENYIVNNSKIKIAIKKDLPLSSQEGMIQTFKSFSKNA